MFGAWVGCSAGFGVTWWTAGQSEVSCSETWHKVELLFHVRHIDVRLVLGGLVSVIAFIL